MTDKSGISKYTLEDFVPVIRNVVTYAAGIATGVGVLKSADQATLLDAITHIGNDLTDIFKYLGIVAGIVMPIWVHYSSNIFGIIASLKRKAPGVVVVAPPAIADKSSAQSTADVAIVSKVSGQEVKATT